MNAVGKLIWFAYDVIATAMTTTGLLGLLFFVGVGLVKGFDKLIGEESENGEYVQDHH